MGLELEMIVDSDRIDVKVKEMLRGIDHFFCKVLGVRVNKEVCVVAQRSQRYKSCFDCEQGRKIEMESTSEEKTHEQEVREILDQPEYFKCIRWDGAKLRKDTCVKRQHLCQYKDACGNCDQGIENKDTFNEEELQAILKSLVCKECEENQAEVKGLCKKCYNDQYRVQKKMSVCDCGCGRVVGSGKRFVQGHWNKKVRKVEKLDKEETGVQTKVVEEGDEKETPRYSEKGKQEIKFDSDEDILDSDIRLVDFTNYPDVHKILVKVAKREVRSIENQIVYLVMKSLEDHQIWNKGLDDEESN